MRLRFLIPVLPVVVLSATAASIQTSVTCQAGPETVMGTTGCYVQFQPPWVPPNEGSYADAIASAGAKDSLRRDGYDYGFSVTTSASAFGQGYYPECCELDAAASSTSLLTQWFTTQGPVRNGWIDLLIQGEGDWSPGGSGWATGGIGPYSGRYVAGRFPAPLGVPFLLTLSSSSSASARGDGNHSSHGWSVVNVYFRVWEEDLSMTASVQELSVPEPAGTAVIGILLMSLRLLRSKRRK